MTPAPAGVSSGNRTTALRWASMLRTLGHRVRVGNAWDGRPADVLVALHALKSRAAVLAFQQAHPMRPVIVALTGTDVYDSLGASPDAMDTVRRATRLVVLQPCAVDELPADLRERTHVVIQSSPPIRRRPPRGDRFQVLMLAALRPVKDPLLTARAVRLLPSTSRIHVSHYGAPLDPFLHQACLHESSTNPRYTWHGDRPHRVAMTALSRTGLLVLTSKLEGGANVVSEALAAGVPILSTRIPGSIGLLGADYEGYFPVGDVPALAGLLTRAETDAQFLSQLTLHCASRAPLVTPSRERASLARLIEAV